MLSKISSLNANFLIIFLSEIILITGSSENLFFHSIPIIYGLQLEFKHFKIFSKQNYCPDESGQPGCRQSPAFAGFCYCWNRFSDIINIRRAVFFMMTKNTDKKREQMMMFSMDDMVPQNHMLRLIRQSIRTLFVI